MSCTLLCCCCSMLSAFVCMIANLLLFFPNGERLDSGHISKEVWLMGGLIGGGLLVLFPSCLGITVRGTGCCGACCYPLFCLIGATYCIMVAWVGLEVGPMCKTANGEWEQPFENFNSDIGYLTDRTLWDLCRYPENIVSWHVRLFATLLFLGFLQTFLCGIQLINGFIGCFDDLPSL